MAIFILACQSHGKLTSGGMFLTWILFAVCGLPELYWWIKIKLNPLVNFFYCNCYVSFCIRILITLIYHAILLLLFGIHVLLHKLFFFLLLMFLEKFDIKMRFIFFKKLIAIYYFSTILNINLG